MQKIIGILDILCSVLESFWIFLLIDVIFARQNAKNIWSRYKGAVKFVCVLVSSGIVIIANQIALVSPYTVFIWATIVVVCSCQLWQCDFMEALGVVGMYTFLLFIFSNIVIAVVNGLGGERLLYKVTAAYGIYRLYFLLIYHIIWGMLNLLLYHLLRKIKLYLVGAQYFGAVLLVGAGGSAYFAMQLLKSFRLQINLAWYIFLGFVLSLLYGVYLRQRNLEYQFEIQAVTSHNKLLEENYKQLSDYYHENAKLYHDINRHFRILHQMLENGEEQKAVAYLEKIVTPIKQSRIPLRSGVDILDVVFWEMEKKADAKKLKISFSLGLLPTKMSIEKEDLCILFANLLDNAIEAANTQVIFEVKQVQKMMAIIVKNDYVNKPQMRNGKFVTTKADKSKHGFGTRIIKQVVQKYDGDIQYSVEADSVCVEIMLSDMA